MEFIFALIITIRTPGNQLDITKIYPQQSLEKCWEAAKTVLESDIPSGARALEAGCGKQAKPEKKS